MQVCVRLFARLRELAAADAVTLELPHEATVGDLRARLSAAYPSASSLLERSAVAVNQEFAEDAFRIPVGSEVALLPPVSGGDVGARPSGE
jgi:molybdopterin converting factor subunit 1